MIALLPHTAAQPTLTIDAWWIEVWFGEEAAPGIAGPVTKRDGIFSHATKRDGLFAYPAKRAGRFAQRTKRPGVLA